MTTPEPYEGAVPDETNATPLPEVSSDQPHARDVSHTRTRATYIGWIVGILVTIGLLVFIVQNTDTAEINFFGLSAELPIGVSLLIAAIAGALITVLLSGARLIQLRRALKKATKG